MTRPRLSLCCLENRLTPSAAQYAAALNTGSAPIVNVYDNTGLLYTVTPYDPAFRGGVRVAMGDINGDGVPDLVTAAGTGGGPHIKVFDGVTHAVINQFLAYDSAFTGGVYVATGDVDGNGSVDIITGAGRGGGPHVKAFDGMTGAVISSFFAYNTAFRGGVSVAAGDVQGDGAAEIITGAGFGGGPHVRVFDKSGGVLSEFMAYTPTFTGGIYVAAGNIDGVGKDEIITGTLVDGGPHVKAFDATGAVVASFMAYDSSSRGGVTVASVDLNGDGHDEIITGNGPGGPALCRIWDMPGSEYMSEFYAFDQSQIMGCYVG
jgi:hypothetical protein